MKTLRYLLMSLAIVSVLSISAQEPAQDWGKQPEATMHSTSVMVGSGSTLPSAASSGAVVTGEQPGTYSPAFASSRPRRALDGDDEDKPKPGQPFPIGDAALPLALLALVFVFGKWTAKKLNHSAK